MPESRKLLLIGGGGHCKSIIDILKTDSMYNDIGIIDKRYSKEESTIMEIPIIGHDGQLEFFYDKGYRDAFISIGSVGNPLIRKELYKKIKRIGFHMPNIIDCTSTISSTVRLGEGNFIGKRVVINAEVELGNCVILNTGSIIEHECKIEDFVHISPGSIVCGNILIERETHIGAGSVLKQGIRIGANSIIGMGSIVLKDISSNVTAYGNPCREERILDCMSGAKRKEEM